MPHNVLLYLNSPFFCHDQQTLLCVLCPFRKPDWYLTMSFRGNLRFGKRYIFHIFLMFEIMLLVCSWSFLCIRVISVFFKFDGNTDDAMQLLRLRYKKSANISLLFLITLRAISLSWRAFFTSNLFISLVSRDTCLKLKALSLWFSNISTTLGCILNLSIILRTRSSIWSASDRSSWPNSMTLRAKRLKWRIS